MQFEELARHYREAADALVKCTFRNRSTLDVHVYAICFLYRHSCELLRKGLFRQSGYALSGDQQLRGGHGLQSLWAEVETRTRRLLDSDFPLAATEVAMVKQLFADIEEHDEGSDSFRYPIDSKGKGRTHPTLRNVNVRALRDLVHESSELLGRIHHLVDYHYTQRMGGRKQVTAFVTAAIGNRRAAFLEQVDPTLVLNLASVVEKSRISRRLWTWIAESPSQAPMPPRGGAAW